MSASASLRSEVFAGNRAVGKVTLSVAVADGVSRRARVYEAGSLRVRFPNTARDGALDAVIVNTAGGMAGGDRFTLDVKVGPDARLTVTTAAAEKIYRSLGPDTEIGVRLDVDPGGSLNWLPQETILYDRIRLRRSIDVELSRDSNLLLAEAVVFGRSAMGETVVSGFFQDRWRVRIDGALAFAETTRLDGDIARHLAERAVAARSVAVATLLKIPGDDTTVATVRGIERNFSGEVGASAWNGLAIVRFVAPDGAALRRDLVTALSALRATPPPRLWMN